MKVKLDRRGLLAMGNNGKHSNTSQFFITFAPCTKLSGKHVCFGEMIEGEEVLALIESSASGGVAGDESPVVPVVIADCGLLEE